MSRIVGAARFAFLCVTASSAHLLIPCAARAQLLDPGWQLAPQGGQDSGVNSGIIAHTFGNGGGQYVVPRPYQPAPAYAAPAYGAPSYQTAPRGYQAGTQYYVVAPAQARGYAQQTPQYYGSPQSPGGYQQPNVQYYAQPASQPRGLQQPAPVYYQQQPMAAPQVSAYQSGYQQAPQYDQPPSFLMQLFGRADPAPAYAPSSMGDMAHPVVDPKYDRQLVDYPTGQPPGTIIIDTPHYFLYLVLDGGKALRYGIGVGRPGFAWAGTKEVSAMRQWPDWRPPDEMLKRRPELPRFMPGGPDNPLGARAIYLGSTLYRIHGSNEPWTIGTQVSSGCIRLRNEDVIDLYGRVKVGTKVIVI
jgi:lipoprotein-anchoring transpeptidase ErfK/SrfK